MRVRNRRQMNTNDIILHETIVEGNRVTFQFEPRGTIKEYFTTNTMFLEYDKPMTDVPVSILNIAFVSSIIPLIWLTDTTLWVYDIDRTYYEALLRIKSAYQDLYSQCKLGGIFVPARVTVNTYTPERESLLLFGGGVDAHTTFLRIKETSPVICHIQGWFDSISECSERTAEKECGDIMLFANSNSLPFAYVKSNFATLVDSKKFALTIGKRIGDSWWHGFQHSMSFISIAMPLCYLYKVRNVYIGSSFSVGHAGFCSSYATTDIEFRFATVGGCIHDAFDVSRQEKVSLLVDYQKRMNKPYPICVCSFNQKNCCACEKCFRTVLEITAAGGDPHNFGFDIHGNLKPFYQNVMAERIALYDVKGESKKHWPDIKERMRENYQNIEEKDFVDWFLNYDFMAQRKKALRQYYRKNFFSILKKKIFQR